MGSSEFALIYFHALKPYLCFSSLPSATFLFSSLIVPGLSKVLPLNQEGSLFGKKKKGKKKPKKGSFAVPHPGTRECVSVFTGLLQLGSSPPAPAPDTGFMPYDSEKTNGKKSLG